METNKIKKLGLGAGMTLGIVFVCAILMFWNVNDVVTEQVVERDRSWQLLPLGDADPGAGASGVLIAGIADDDCTWTSNLTYGVDTYHTTETNDTHAGDNVPYDTDVYIFVKCRFNVSDLVDTDGADTFNLNWVSAWLNSTILGASSVEMTENNISGVSNCDTNMIFVHFSAGPYQWTRGQNVTDIQMKIKIYK